MLKSTRLLVCLIAMLTASIIIQNPHSAFAKQKEESIAKKEGVVYVTRNGKKYHAETCPFIKNRETTSMELKEAAEKGLEPCGRCFKEKDSL